MIRLRRPEKRRHIGPERPSCGAPSLDGPRPLEHGARSASAHRSPKRRAATAVCRSAHARADDRPGRSSIAASRTATLGAVPTRESPDRSSAPDFRVCPPLRARRPARSADCGEEGRPVAILSGPFRSFALTRTIDPRDPRSRGPARRSSRTSQEAGAPTNPAALDFRGHRPFEREAPLGRPITASVDERPRAFRGRSVRQPSHRRNDRRGRRSPGPVRRSSRTSQEAGAPTNPAALDFQIHRPFEREAPLGRPSSIGWPSGTCRRSENVTRGLAREPTERFLFFVEPVIRP
ncbi:MAG: hypothetical protein KatS3mg117_2606 [Geminicoccaceae bacterium]|nr:MAG: hypothetical protein KatS3mg117_2606 [Geminicoccaceae bacterium]